jgi:hypothetical protein
MKKVIGLSLLGIISASFIVLTGCSTSNSRTVASNSHPDGARLWSQNCVRCHNSRPPTEYSSAQWDVVMLHMRVRAGLAAKDANSIREFLHSAN